ncbi:MAG: hypothetical protein C0413_02445 [Clostridiales bacterium]|nr:hypothetical protein [Clostridiales bacterium]
MNGNVRRRVSVRVISTLILTAVLALLPPILYHDLIYGKFFLEDAAKDIANQYLNGTRWIHLGAIAAIWLVNLVFFIVNQKKSDSGKQLISRTRLQNFLNVLLIVCSVAAMIGYRYALSSDVWIGLLFGTADNIKLIVWMPYWVVAACGLFLWRFCMCAAPATNCHVKWLLAKWLDAPMTRAERTR